MNKKSTDSHNKSIDNSSSVKPGEIRLWSCRNLIVAQMKNRNVIEIHHLLFLKKHNMISNIS